MKTTTLEAKQTNNKRLIALFVLLLLSCVGMFGQELTNNVSVTVSTTNTPIVSSSTNNDSQLELISWFMGSKQIQISNAAKNTNTISTNNSGKKNMINCGMTPNRVLSRAFMKKAVNYDTTIA